MTHRTIFFLSILVFSVDFPQAQVVMNKTVGVVGTGCATTESTIIAPGTTVYYCYTLTNNTGTSYTAYNLVDDQLGLISSGPNMLGPGATVTATAQAVITATTTNVATWTVAASDGPALGVVDTALVTVGLGPPPRLEGILTKTVGLDSGVCGTETSLAVPAGTAVAYCYTFQNNSTIPLNYHTLVDDKIGTIASDDNVVVAPGGTLQQIITATITADTVNNATWTASEGPSSEPGPTVAPAASASVTVTPVFSQAPIPTLSEWGILLLGGLLLGAGVLVLRRERSQD